MSENVRSAIITGVVGICIVLAVRIMLRAAFEGYLDRFAADRHSPEEVAGLRTRFTILERLTFVILLAIVAWSVLENFAATQALARSLLASSAIFTIFVGLALSGPLSNMGAGILLGLAQPLRLGDRVTVGEASGTTTEITLFHTVLVTEDGRRVFVPNTQMAGSIVTNRSFDDPVCIVSVRLPIALGAPVERARQAVLDAAGGVEGGAAPTDMRVVLGELTESTAWLTLTGSVPPGSDVELVSGELRERALDALAREELLPA